MPFGYTLIGLALVLTVAANVLFTVGRRNGGEGLVRWARWATVGAAASVVGASAYLCCLIATHHFEVAYVAEYSAKRSSPRFLFAAFWGGQEGSILLWTFWGAVLGAILAFRAGGRTSRIWPLYGILQVFLLSLLLLKCPFALGAGPTPPDGKGLNPLLENLWMVIHPPILFLGFASLMPVFAWCLYGLVYRDWDGWVKAAFPWALFAFATLGFGLSLGGYWAYETLGWGGFWGWDPVENSSLVPWLFMTALLHGIPIQNKNGGYKVTNLVLGFLPFAFMFYGTFLTRTGLLADFSVHSFSSLGKDGFYMLLGGVIAAFLIPTVLLLMRLRSIPKPVSYERVLTREFGYFLASALLGVLGLIVAVGMSAPLITKLWLAKGAAAQPSFYNQSAYPLAILLTVAMAATPYLAWKATDDKELGRRLLKPYIVALVLTMGITAAAFFLGVRKPLMVLLFAAASFAVMANLWLVVPRMRTKPARRTVGGFIAHMGVGMLLAGIACLIAFSQSAERVMLIKDVPTERLGTTFIYRGMTHQPYDRDNNALRIEVQRGKYVWEANPRYYFAPWDNKDTMFGNPPAILPSVYAVHSAYDVLRLLPWNNPFWFGDLYIALNTEPHGIEAPNRPNPNSGFTLAANETKSVGDYTFAFRNMGFDEATRGAAGNPEAMKHLPQIFVQATVDVTYRGQTVTTMPQLRLEQTGGTYALPAQIPGPAGRTVMLKLEPPSDQEQEAPLRMIHLATLNAEDPTETVFLDVSTKPGIGLVWMGTLLYTIGGLIAYRRRALETRLLGAPESDEPRSEKKPAPSPAPHGKKNRGAGRMKPEPARAE
jgi:cytochrome c-type biogenesis protein CcmF